MQKHNVMLTPLTADPFNCFNCWRSTAIRSQSAGRRTIQYCWQHRPKYIGISAYMNCRELLIAFNSAVNKRH